MTFGRNGANTVAGALGDANEESDVDAKQERRLAFASAQAWGADEAFETLVQQARAKRPRLV